MSCPFVPSKNSDTLAEATAPSPKQQKQKQEVSEVVVTNQMLEEKEKRLADFVASMGAEKNTKGAEGFKREQKKKIGALISDLLTESQKVYLD